MMESRSRTAYLDHAATSPMPDAVREAYVSALQLVGNPASTHGHGQRASEALEAARDQIAARLGCDHAELMFTSGGTESINLALKGIFWARQRAGARPVVLLADGEHHASIEAAEWLRDTQGAVIDWLPIDAQGVLHPETVRAAIARHGAENIALLSFLWANNEVGAVQPVHELCGIAQRAEIPAHVDAVAALGQLPVRLHDSGAAAISVSAHKIGGPVGVGALLLGRHHSAEALIHGGSQQRVRSGTQNVAGAIAFAAALELVVDSAGVPWPEAIARVQALRDRVIAEVQRIDPGAQLRGPEGSGRLPGNAHFTFSGCQGDSLVFLLDLHGVSASVGSACQAGVAEISHVLLAMGLSSEEAAGALRFTLSAATRDDEISALLDALPEAILRARAAGVTGV